MIWEKTGTVVVATKITIATVITSSMRVKPGFRPVLMTLVLPVPA